MLENARLVLTVDIPCFLRDVKFPGIETFYCDWVNLWIDYGDTDWIKEAFKRHWDACDDSKESVSRFHYAEELLNEHKFVLEEHFNKLTSDITHVKLPSQITVKPTSMVGVVMWIIA